MKLKPTLIPATFATGKDPAKAAWKAQASDYRPVEVITWGEGTERSPFRFMVQIGLPELLPEGELPTGTPKPDPKPTPREPSPRELQEIVNQLSPEGTFFQRPWIISQGENGKPEELLPQGTEWVGIPLLQIGVVAGSPAARTTLILSSPGGKDHAN